MASSVLRASSGGSATAIRWNGRPCVVTAWHVVDDVPKHTVWISGNNHQRLVGPFKHIEDRDVAWAVVQSPPTNWTFLEVAGNNDDHGACMVWGFPGGDGLRAYRCTDSGWVKLGPNKARWFRGPAIPGMSGGPIVDNDNRVIGVVSHSQRPYTENFYAGPICDIVPLFGGSVPARVPAAPVLPEDPAPVIHSTSDLPLPAWAAGR